MTDAALATPGDRPPLSMTGPELTAELVELAGLAERLEQRRMAVLAVWDSRIEYRAEGHATATTGVAHRLCTSRSFASQSVRDARALAAAPVVASHLGSLGSAKAKVIARARTDRTADAFDAQVAELVAACAELSVDHTADLVRVWKRMNDPDGPEPVGPGSLNVSVSDGKVVINGTLHGPDSILIKNLIDLFATQIRDAEKSCDDGRPPSSAGQRRAQALLEIFRAATAVDPDTSEPARSTVMVNIDLAWLEGLIGRPAWVEGMGSITRTEALKMACDAGIARVLTSAERCHLDQGRRIYTPSRTLRRHLIHRDRGCAVPGCDRRPIHCEAHHIQAFLQGGETVPDNLVLLCWTHHTMVHTGHLEIRPRGHGRFTYHRHDGTQIPDHHPAPGTTPTPSHPPP